MLVLAPVSAAQPGQCCMPSLVFCSIAPRSNPSFPAPALLICWPHVQLDGGELVRLQLEGGAALHTRLLVGADGCGSLVRRWAKVSSRGLHLLEYGPALHHEHRMHMPSTLSAEISVPVFVWHLAAQHPAPSPDVCRAA